MQLTHLMINEEAIELRLTCSASMMPLVWVLMGLKLILPLIFVGIEAWRSNDKAKGFYSAGMFIAGSVVGAFYIWKGIRNGRQKRAPQELADGRAGNLQVSLRSAS
jgi:hypothetical protein